MFTLTAAALCNAGEACFKTGALLVVPVCIAKRDDRGHIVTKKVYKKY
jgi:hypothetical protein